MLDPKSGIHLHQQLRQIIAGDIRSGKIKAGDRLPTEQEMCEIHSVSRTTLRQALEILEKEGYIERTRGRGTFACTIAPHRYPGAWVGIVGTTLDNPLAVKVIAGAERVLRDRDLCIKFFPANDEPSHTEQMIALAHDQGAVGLLVYPAEGTCYSEQVRCLVDKGFPVCLFDRSLQHVTTDCAMTDNVKAGFLAASHLIYLGHERIAFASPSAVRSTYSVGSRYEGCVSALSLAGLKPCNNFIVSTHTDIDAWLTMVKEGLEAEDRPTAVIASNDDRAMEIIHIAVSIGLRVPEDLAVVGFDNSDIGARFMVPLTSVIQPLEDIGAAAARLMLERMDNPALNFRWNFLAPSLAVRRSSGGGVDLGAVSGQRSIRRIISKNI